MEYTALQIHMKNKDPKLIEKELAIAQKKLEAVAKELARLLASIRR